ncbi:MAG: signal recognition particle protein [Nanoarchaeota archaeon]|nr:signal recognition particle protein [Nanoarchaeota archaeon]
MLDNLSNSLKETFKKIASLNLISDADVDEILKDVQRALLRNDVSVRVVSEISSNVRARVKKESKGLTKKERFIKSLYDELVSVMGYGEEFEVGKKPFKILLVGLFGSGKTTTSAKIAFLLKKKGYKTCMVSLDNYRPAAFEQLKQLGDANGIKVFGEKGLKKQLNPWKKNEKDLLKHDVIIIDSAGRDSLQDKFVKEIVEVKKITEPDEVLLVVPAEIGQGVEALAKNFHDNLNITGIIITKMDTSAKGGGALTASHITKTPVKFITTGEGVGDVEFFKPKRFVSRILGMGDVESLLENVSEHISVESAEKTAKKFVSGKLSLIDFYEQIDSLNKMGSFKKIFSMMPQLGALGKIDNSMLDSSKEKMSSYRVVMQSMTLDELENPKKLNPSRVSRIAQGSGVSEKDVRELIRAYNQISKLSKQMDKRKMNKMMRKMGL